eukprot:jgi/Tetstr1/444158/TSEL_032052.t1
MGTVRAALCRRLGDPAGGASAAPALAVEDVVRRELAEREVRIRVAAAGVNFADVLQLQGKYQEKPSLPFVPGSELSGEVIEVGPGVASLRPGDAVVAVVSTGAFAAEAVAPEVACWALPPGVDVAAAAGLPIAFGTAHVALALRAGLRPGQVVLVLGAAGGVGLAAVALTKLMGGTVVAVAAGAAKGAAVRAAGADFWVDSADPKLDLRSAVKAVVPSGVDILFDTVGGRAFSAGIRCMKWGGEVLVIGFASGEIPRIATNVVLVKNLTLHGVYWGMYLRNSPSVLRDSMQQLLAWAAEGRLAPRVCARFPLEQVQQALGVLFSRKAIGKVLLLPEAPGPGARL